MARQFPTLRGLLAGGVAACVVCVLLAAAAPPASAGNFSVSPVRLFFQPRDRAVAVTLANEGDEDIAMQADVYRWWQTADGADRLELSDDLVVWPPSVRLPARSRQVVRLALLAPRDPAAQMSYRLVVRELPEARARRVKAPDATANGEADAAPPRLPIALVLNLPVFITPAGARRDLQCERAAPNAASTPAAGLTVTCHNRGTAHAQLREVVLSRQGQTLARHEGALYLLPGTTRTLPLTLQPGAALAAGPAELTVAQDEAVVQRLTVTLP